MTNDLFFKSLCLCVCFTAAVSCVFAQKEPTRPPIYVDGNERSTLQALNGVHVVVEDLIPELEEDGLTRGKLQTDVELRIRKARIKMLSEEEGFNAPGSPYLYVRVTALKDESCRGYAAEVEVMLKQKLELTRITIQLPANLPQPKEPIHPPIKSATTWQSGVLVTVPVSKVNHIREVVGDVVDRFINDYLAVNPK